MNSYVVKAPLCIKKGLIFLEKEQVRAREHAIQAEDSEGLYRVIDPVYFTAGEYLKTSQQLNPNLVEIIDDKKSEEKSVNDSTSQENNDESYTVSSLQLDLGHETIEETQQYLLETFEEELNADDEISIFLLERLIEMYGDKLSVSIETVTE
ncbi:MAG: hypothetical protein AAGI66_09015 [Cyanobacteria bacterium P01_H01_bin.74]